MAVCKDELALAECLMDPSLLVESGCEQAKRVRAIALARIAELMCSCWTKPIAIGSGESRAEYPSPIEAIEALRRVILMTNIVCQQEAELEGPVMETIWQDRCGHTTCQPSRCCSGGGLRYTYQP